MIAPRDWQELWRRTIRNECTAEAYARVVTQQGIQAVRPLSLPGMEGGISP